MFVCRTDFQAGVQRLSKLKSKMKYFIDPEIEHVLVFPPNTKFFENEIYLKRHLLLMDKVVH